MQAATALPPFEVNSRFVFIQQKIATLVLTVAALALILSSQTSASAAEKASDPNIIYILADDMGYGDIRALNPECKIATPHLDQLAHGGMIFTDRKSVV